MELIEATVIETKKEVPCPWCRKPVAINQYKNSSGALSGINTYAYACTNGSCRASGPLCLTINEAINSARILTPSAINGCVVGAGCLSIGFILAIGVIVVVIGILGLMA